MVHVIPGNCSRGPELQTVGHRPSVKSVVECVVVTPHVGMFVRVEQLIDGEIAGNANGLPSHQKRHHHHQWNLHDMLFVDMLCVVSALHVLNMSTAAPAVDRVLFDLQGQPPSNLLIKLTYLTDARRQA